MPKKRSNVLQIPLPELPEETEFPKISGSRIRLSQTKTQLIRRKRYTEKNLRELADSLRTQGVLEPIIIRPIPFTKDFELVAGERRKRAGELAEISEFPAIIRNISDEQVITIQLHENLHRENPHPMDEAYNYAFMRDDLGYSVEKIAKEVGKETSHVSQRLKLYTLPENIREAYEHGDITLRHAQEIAKFPEEDHQEIFSYCFSNFGHTSQALYPFAKAKTQIEQHYLLQLSKAPFPLDSTELRADGLACIKCTNRTSAHPLLFETDEGFENIDKCFNRECYNKKVERFVQIKRENAAKNVINFPPEKAKETIAETVPLVATRAVAIEKKQVKENIVSIDEVLIVNKDSCRFAKIGIVMDGEKTAQEIYYCSNTKYCPNHRTTPIDETTREEIEQKLLSKEEDFQVLVGETVRCEVLKLVSQKVTSTLITFNDRDFEKEFTAKIWHLQCSSDVKTAELIRSLLGLRSDQLSIPSYSYSTKELSSNDRIRLFFLINYVDKCRMTTSYQSQHEIKELAKNFGIDYQLIDAQERMKLADERHRKVFYDYLQRIENGQREAVIPQVYSEKWERKD